MVLFGGRSAEHDVSRVTAAAVAKALDPDRYDVIPVAITTDGQWHAAEDAAALLAAGPELLPTAFPVEGPELESLGTVVATSGRRGLDVDVVLPLLHGPFGEDGTVQGLLELADLPYVGSGVLGSAVGMHKGAMKQMFKAAGIPQCAFLEFREGQDLAAFRARVISELGLPCFVKPANMGSSVGVSKAHTEAELDAAIALALTYDEEILAEEMVTGREIEVAVLGSLHPEASLPGEVVPGAEFYSYADKYEDGAAQLLAPAPLSDAATEEVRALALRAFTACRCDGMARVDCFYDEGGRGFLLNEVNTIPGFTPISMYPKLWEVSGVPYPALLDRLIELAIERHDRRTARAGRQR
ncbi:MAG: D-alanine--D-alanine ligase [Acidimicrobiia bacterium]|nr:D-alanine--D-alanine ligase [Acidimicrobiia bacterium]